MDGKLSASTAKKFKGPACATTCCKCDDGSQEVKRYVRKRSVILMLMHLKTDNKKRESIHITVRRLSHKHKRQSDIKSNNIIAKCRH